MGDPADTRFIGSVLTGLGAVLSAGVAIWVLGMSAGSHREGFGTAVGVFFYGACALLMVTSVIIAMMGARRAQGRDRRALLTLAVAMPAVGLVVIVTAASVLL
ncbi:hypothetical protein GCM10027064_20100 [Microbacterium petrolearium]|jgi:uncharacterized membrane protein YhaH (DUF805 family)